MAVVTFSEPYPTVAAVDGHAGPIEIMAFDPTTGDCMARIPEIDPTTGGVDGERWAGTLDPDDQARFTAMCEATEPPNPIGVDDPLSPGHVDINRVLMGIDRTA